MSDYKNTLNSSLVVIYRNVEGIKKTNEAIKKLLEENQKNKIDQIVKVTPYFGLLSI